MNTRDSRPPQKRSFQRFSLRTLFFVSFLVMSPFLLAAFVGTDFQTGDAGGAPIFLLMGAGLVVMAAAVGYSLGSRRGAFIATLTTGGLWLGIAFLLLGDVNTVTSLRMQAGGALVSTTAVCCWLYWHAEPEGTSATDASLTRLRSAKKKSLEGRWSSPEKPDA